MKTFEMNETIYKVRNYLTNSEFDQIFAALEGKDLENLKVTDIAQLLQKVRPILKTYIQDPKIVNVDELDAGLTMQIAMHILTVEIPKIMAVLPKDKVEQKKS